MLFINILKSFVGAMNDHTWDALGVTTNWNSFLILSIIFLLLSFFSITISLPSSRPCPTIQLRFQPFCPLTLSSFFASLILPQRACWFYFLALWVSTHEIVSTLTTAFVQCLETTLSTIPGYDIGATTAGLDEAAAAIPDLEMGRLPQTE